MTPEQITYLVFGIVVVLALVFDLGLMSKKTSEITMKKALGQTIFWVTLALGFLYLYGLKTDRNRHWNTSVPT